MRDAMTIRVTTPDSCNPRNENRADAYRPAISWRKLLILQWSALSRAWDIAFPQHDFGTGRLRQYSLDSFERSCDRAEADRAGARQRGVSPGGDIMIHGLPNGLGWLGSFHLRRDWTDGCIAVTNAEIEEIWARTDVGTAVEIKP